MRETRKCKVVYPDYNMSDNNELNFESDEGGLVKISSHDFFTLVTLKEEVVITFIKGSPYVDEEDYKALKGGLAK